MAKYSTSWTSLTMTATADTTTFGNSVFCAIGSNAAAAMGVVSEVYIGGEAASASTPATIVVARDSTNGATPSATGVRTALTNAMGLAPATAPTGFTQATTNPQRSATAHLLHLSFNAYGGIVRWVASPDQYLTVATATAPNSEISISAITAATAPVTSGHFLYEIL
jgi:hypothetical protein